MFGRGVEVMTILVGMEGVVATRLERGDGGRGFAALRAPCRDTKRRRMKPGEGFLGSLILFMVIVSFIVIVISRVGFGRLFGLYVMECFFS